MESKLEASRERGCAEVACGCQCAAYKVLFMGLEQFYMLMFSDDDGACTNSYLRVNCREPHTHTREESGKSLQFSCLGNPVDRGAWLVKAHGVSMSRTRLSD